MRKIVLFLIIVNGFIFNGCAQVDEGEIDQEIIDPVSEDVVFEVDFEKSKVGIYSKQNLIQDCGEIRWASFDDRANIVVDPMGIKGNVLKVDYPKLTVGPATNGIQFIKTLPEATEYFLDYYVYFEDGFDFKQGGKLPGLTSGGSTFTGGVHPDNGEGWSARYMWVQRSKGIEAIVYFYYIDMNSKYGESVDSGVYFKTKKWYRLTQRIKLNDNNLSNGEMQVWIDGVEVINRSEIRYRLWGKGAIDSFYFSTFHGGADESWMPQNDSFAMFDNIRVTTYRPF